MEATSERLERGFVRLERSNERERGEDALEASSERLERGYVDTKDDVFSD